MTAASGKADGGADGLLRDIYADYVAAYQAAVSDGIHAKNEPARQMAKIRETNAKQRIDRITAHLATPAYPNSPMRRREDNKKVDKSQKNR